MSFLESLKIYRWNAKRNFGVIPNQRRRKLMKTLVYRKTGNGLKVIGVCGAGATWVSVVEPGKIQPKRPITQKQHHNDPRRRDITWTWIKPVDEIDIIDLLIPVRGTE
jgi:hypothetical protein